jgi:hypothetical protein
MTPKIGYPTSQSGLLPGFARFRFTQAYPGVDMMRETQMGLIMPSFVSLIRTSAKEKANLPQAPAMQFAKRAVRSAPRPLCPVWRVGVGVVSVVSASVVPGYELRAPHL